MSKLHSYVLAAAALHTLSCSSNSDSRNGNVTPPNMPAAGGTGSGGTGMDSGAVEPPPPSGIGAFQEAVNYAKSFPDVWVGTVLDVGAYWRGQTAFAAATQATEGSSTTFSWTLPEHFPPGKFLRATVDGGTLTQDGAPLVWNDHGFYEIALDKRSVTLAP